MVMALIMSSPLLGIAIMAVIGIREYNEEMHELEAQVHHHN